MTIEVTLERIAGALESLVSIAQGKPAAMPPAQPADAPKDPVKTRAKPSKVTAEEKANATPAEPVGKAAAVTSDDIEPKKYTDGDVRAALQDYAKTFDPGLGTKEARALMVKSAKLDNAAAKIADLKPEQYGVVVGSAKAETAKRKKTAAEAL